MDDDATREPRPVGRYGDWRDAFSGSSTAGLVCRECHALVAHRGDHPQQHLAWHQRMAERQS
ncbi:hypothetical protein KDN32_14635 [Nocardioides sp. J2M5]|uniref:hypothetical protein n=1 Tax=Nocardioides palaemonis TaxID=2829810 RepID=UPI001BA94E56|nr:hypothetical protein [Nocardioides palaemonis]MBS2938973.1 hypothetical protein [Nocardioides palaemonis]